jgi:membrane protein DedA with SNARE-associated domain
METALQLVSQYGDLALFFLLIFGIIGLPVPDETLLTFAGYLIFKGHLHFPTTLAAAFAGSVCGITGSYLIGRTGGLFVIHKYGRYVHITPERLDYVHAWFERVGRFGLFFGYFIPGIRHFTAIIAGTSALEFPVFALFAYSGALAWVSTFLTLGYFLGEEWNRMGARIQHWGEEIAMVVVALALIGFGIRYWMKRRAGK